MGLRTASVRHSEVVMAPALTETTQSQNFKLAPKDHFKLATPINNFEAKNTFCLNKHIKYFGEDDQNNGNTYNCVENGCKIYNNFEPKKAITRTNSEISEEASENFTKLNLDIMNHSSPSMGDQKEKMGNQNMDLETVTMLNKAKHVATDVEQLLHNFSSELPPNDCSGGEIPTNVDDIMQVITSIEDGNDRLSSVTTSLNDEDFPIAGDLARDLASSLLNFEKQLLNDVDMMNMSIEDQQECESVESIKESQTKDLIAEAHKKQVDLQRRLDFMKRRVLKIQSRLMGQHASGEITGVFEHVQRSLKRLKDSTIPESVNPLDITSTPNSSLPLPLTEAPSLDKVLKPMSQSSAKILVRKLEASSVIQANSAARQKHVPKYFGSGSIEPATFRTSVSGLVAIPPWTPEQKQELQRVSGALKSQLRLVQSEIDSEATDSSSGGESCDEFQNYNNQHQQYLSIQKRALWKYTTDRAAIASRWTWLQVQISDLEYRIRQHTELHRQIRSAKGQVILEGPDPVCPDSPPLPTATTTFLNGYRGQLPGAPTPSTSDSSSKTTYGDDTTQTTDCSGSAEVQCARTRPLVNFRKRKLLRTGGLHVVSKKAARPSTVRCGCPVPASHCAICTGRTDPTHPRDQPEVLSTAEKVALLDPSYHPVLSMGEDISESLHYEAIMKMPEWQQRSARMKTVKGYAKGERLDKTLLDHRSKKLEHRKKYGRLLKPSTISALTAKIKNKIRGRKPNRHMNRVGRKRRHSSMRTSQVQSSNEGIDEEVESLSNNSALPRSAGESPSSSPLLHMQSISGLNKKNRVSSYDIDNIVIPYSVAASTRVEKLQYKEILTPKWRIVDDACTKYESKNNGTIKEPEEESDTEDISDEAIAIRHDKCEQEERKKFLSYLKMPIGYGRSRSHKRTDSRAESSDTNTPDPMSPHPPEHHESMKESASPLASPPATPQGGVSAPDESSAHIPSISVLRRRTFSRGLAKDKEVVKEENRCNTPEQPEVLPYETRTFPLDDQTYEDMIKDMPEDHLQLRANVPSQDMQEEYDNASVAGAGYLDSKVASPGSESTESALADEDPNDPEWIEVDKNARDRQRR